MNKPVSIDLKLVLDKMLCDMRRRQFPEQYEIKRLIVNNHRFYDLWWLDSEWCVWVSTASIRQYLLAKGFPWRRNPILIDDKKLTMELNKAGLIAAKSVRTRWGPMLERNIGISLFALQEMGFNVSGLMHE
jgi:hypothetical protein